MRSLLLLSLLLPLLGAVLLKAAPATASANGGTACAGCTLVVGLVSPQHTGEKQRVRAAVGLSFSCRGRALVALKVDTHCKRVDVIYPAAFRRKWRWLWLSSSRGHMHPLSSVAFRSLSQLEMITDPKNLLQ